VLGVKLGTWNVNGIRKRSTEVLSWIDREEPDVVCLQETKAALHQLPAPIVEVPGYHCHWHGHPGYSGVALMLRAKTFGETPPVFTHPRFDIETRIAVAEIDDVVYGTVYGPNGGKDYAAKIEFWKELVLWAAELREAGKYLVLCGDFNIARLPIDVHPMLRKDMIGQSVEERTLFEQLLSHGLVDLHRKVDPDNDRLFTWWAPWRNMRQRNIGWRLDYVIASRELIDDTSVCAAYRDFGTSDHGTVIAHIRDTPLTGA